MGSARTPDVGLRWHASVIDCCHSERKFCDRPFPVQAVVTADVSDLQPVTPGSPPAEPGYRLGDFLRAAHPSAQFFSFILTPNSHLIFATVIVGHTLPSKSHRLRHQQPGNDAALRCMDIKIKSRSPIRYLAAIDRLLAANTERRPRNSR